MARRIFLKAGAAGALVWAGGGWIGCAGVNDLPDRGDSSLAGAGDAAPPADGGATDLARGFADLEQTPACDEPTEPDGEGPYYTPGAPRRTSLVDDGTQGPALWLRGQVRALGSCAPVVGATIDLWQADAGGGYDLSGFRLRGVFAADDQGLFSIPTVLPGRYLNGATYRPRHLHIKVRAPGRPVLTTQLYFPGDPFNQSDGFFDEALLVEHTDVSGGSEARFDFVLA